MGPTQGIQGYQVIQILNNNIYGSTGGNSLSSYISTSGIKSVLLNAWNTVKSAVSGMLSSFGLHLSEQQGSDKPGRVITLERFSARENIYEDPKAYRVISGETGTAEADDPANHIYEDLDVYRVVSGETGTAEADDLENNLYEDTGAYRVVSGETGTAEADDPVNHIYEDTGAYRVVSGETGTAEADDPVNHIYEDLDVYRVVSGETGTAEADDLENNLYEDPGVYRVVSGETGTAETDDPANHIYEDLDVYRDTDNVIDSGNMVLVCDDTYAVPRDSLDAGSNVKSEEPGYESLHENNYAVPYKPGNTVSIPDNDRKHSLPDVQLQQRIMRERLYTL
ncbi:hypothetical protein [Morganella morganii]|uniref:hypothetical protein n=1 Tax=Morganella morganii TaxID=582 RepID=UPI00141A06C8|nr:hypothetical protein [Morganella morganii]NIH20082.1 hypothetical protein [Morganella morganii]